MRIEDSVYQDEVASSLLGPAEQETQPEVEASEYAVAGDDLLNEAIADQENDSVKYGDEMERLRSERPEQEQRDQPEAARQEQQQPEAQTQAPELTVAQVQEGIQQLSADATELGLKTPENNKEYVADFCGVFGKDPYQANIDIDAMAELGTMADVSAIKTYIFSDGDPAKVPPITGHAAEIYKHKFFEAQHLDPRQYPNVDAKQLTAMVLGWKMNFIHAWNSKGGTVSDLRQLNDGQAAIMALQQFYDVLGVNKRADLDTALAFADANTKPTLRALVAWQQREGQRAAEQQRQPRGRSRGPRIPAGMREGIRGSKAPRFKSNQDVFDGGTLDYYHQQHGRL